MLDRASEAGWLPSAHGVAQRVLSFVERSRGECDADDESLAQALELDPSFAANILSLATQTRGRPGILQSLRLLDRRLIRLSASGFCLASEAAADRAAQVAFENALASRIARELAPHVGCEPDTAALAALFAGVGEQAMWEWAPADYAKITECEPKRSERLALERKAFGTDHAELAATWLAAHRLPGRLVSAVASQHELDDGAEVRPLQQVAGLARELAHALAEPFVNGEVAKLSDRHRERISSLCGLSESDWDMLARRMGERVKLLQDVWDQRLDATGRGELLERAHAVAIKAGLDWCRAQVSAPTPQLSDASSDAASGVANRDYLHDRLSQLLKSHKRNTEADVAVWLIGIDGFTELTMEHGADAGAQLLRRVGRALMSAVREVDLVARVDEQTFAILGPNTDWRGACILANRLRQAVGRLRVGGSKELAVTSSIGVATVNGVEGNKTVATVLEEVERQLKCAQDAGGDTWAFRNMSLSAMRAA